jgi:predicted Zn-dependent peptidase
MPEEHGMAHLIEHMLFKGTSRRKAYFILSRMEDVGGELNAYTTKEETCIHGTFFNADYGRAMELISDIAFNSVFPDAELKKEKEIILDEINSYKDSPSELIFDEFEELLFDGNPIARNILGEEEKLKNFTRSNILSFIDRNYATNRMVVSFVGQVPFSRVARFFEKYFGPAVQKLSAQRTPVTYAYKPVVSKLERNTFQAHCIIGNLAYPFSHNKRLALYLLNNFLGGPGMNSRLNLALRERRGYAYTVDSSYTSYSDTGNLTIYFGTDKAQVDKCIAIVLSEMQQLRKKALSHVTLGKAKRQVHGHIAISSENNENHMLSMGKSLMIFDRIDSLEDIGRRIEALTAEELLEVANEILDPDKLTYLIYQ